MFQKVFPEEVGISSSHVYDFVSSLERRGIHSHSMLMLRGDRIFYEGYWAPFHWEFAHRIYSCTKSFVSVAVGLCEEDGLIDLDRPIVSYFPEKIDTSLCEKLQKQTVRQMLTMTTVGGGVSWFRSEDPDRTHLYFSKWGRRRPAGSIWEYDSAGSQVLCALVEKVTGMPLFDFLKERIFQYLGSFQNARILKTPNGDSWGDSAMICTAEDLASFARFVMNYGTWNGQRLMNEEYLRLATARVVGNEQSGHAEVLVHGYGYQFWVPEGGGFLFNGMGDQLALCLPEQDLIFVYFADNQGNGFSRPYVVAQFLDLIASRVADRALSLDENAHRSLRNLTDGLQLYAPRGVKDSPMRERISDAVFVCEPNPMGWKRFSFHFEGADEGELRFVNARGEMVLPFYVNRNRFGLFPEEGYSKDVGGVRSTDGHRYRDAVSLCWTQENKLLLFVQIIDDYFGNASMNFCFQDDVAVLRFSAVAEDFLLDYTGDAIAKRE